MDATPDLPRPPRVPVFNMPAVVTASVGILVLIHAVRQVLPDVWDITLLLDLALVPARWTLALDPDRAADVLKAASASGGSALEVEARKAFAAYLVADPGAMSWTFVSYALLHGSWAHVLLNSVWLAAFGTPVARRCGAGLARLGAFWGHGSGDIAVAFSTAGRIAHHETADLLPMTMLNESRIDGPFRAAAEATQEAVLNAMLAAPAVTGRDGNSRPSLVDALG